MRLVLQLDDTSQGKCAWKLDKTNTMKQLGMICNEHCMYRIFYCLMSPAACLFSPLSLQLHAHKQYTWIKHGLYFDFFFSGDLNTYMCNRTKIYLRSFTYGKWCGYETLKGWGRGLPVCVDLVQSVPGLLPSFKGWKIIECGLSNPS